MIKLDTPHESFVGGWHIDEKICDDLIQLFKDNKEHQKQGVSGGPFNINKKVKDSIDLGLHPDWDEPRFVAYKDALKKCVCTWWWLLFRALRKNIKNGKSLSSMDDLFK